MSEEPTALAAICGSCGKAYRVPRAGRIYACKACGGDVVALEVERPDDVDPPQDPPSREEPPATPDQGARRHAAPRPIAGRANLVLGLLLLCVLVDLVAVYAGLSMRSLLQRAGEQGGVTLEEADAHDLLYKGVGLAQSALWVVISVGWLFWIHRACANLRPLTGKPPRWSPGWAVGWWFVPVLNLWMPFRVTAEIWRGSSRAAAAAAGAGNARPPAQTLLLGWWLAWLLTNLGYGLAGQMQNLAVALREHVQGVDMMTACDAFSALAAALAFLVVRRITLWQRAAGA